MGNQAVGRPPVDESDWAASHAAFLHADRAGRGPEFARAIINERWGNGEVVSSENVLRRAADVADLEPDAIVEASRDEGLRAELVEMIQRNYDERGLFGVPMFILPDGSRFWGHDRMEWAIRYGYVTSAS